VFLALGCGAFILSVVGAAFVPNSLPESLRRWMHPNIFVPLGTVLTVIMLRRDCRDFRVSEPFNPWPVAVSSTGWFVAGVALLGVTVPMFIAAFGFRWSSNGPFNGSVMAITLWGILLTAAAEEIAFRGYALWRLIRLMGFWRAQVIVAGLFAVSHLTLGGYALLPALIGTTAGSLLFGTVFTRTRSLAAPIAMHSGWNIAQHLLLSPLDQTATPFLLRLTHAPSPGEHVLMLLWIGLVLSAATVVALRFRANAVML